MDREALRALDREALIELAVVLHARLEALEAEVGKGEAESLLTAW